MARKLGVAVPNTIAAAAEGAIRPDIDLAPESLHNLGYPIDWDGLLDYVGRPAILKPYSGGGWKHVYKVHDTRRAARGLRRHRALLHDAAAVHPLRSVRPLLHVREERHRAGGLRPARSASTSSSTSISRAELGARIVRDAQTLNNALGYEMNTIEFAVEDGVPYAIDFLNPAPDFERDRITPFYFDMVVQKMADLVIDRALHGTAAADVAALAGDARARRRATPIG